MNNNEKDVKDTKAIALVKHSNQTRHNFNLHPIFIITEQLQDIEKTSNEILKERLKTWETFWNAVYIVQVQLSYCIWNPKSAMTSSSFLMSDLFKLTSDKKNASFSVQNKFSSKRPMAENSWQKLVFTTRNSLFSTFNIYIYIYICICIYAYTYVYNMMCNTMRVLKK